MSDETPLITAEAIQDHIKTCIITQLEQIEDRVPTNQEMLDHGREIGFDDGSKQFTWKHELILQMEPIVENGVHTGFRISG